RRTRGYEQGFKVYGEGFDADGPEKSIRAWADARRKDRPFFLFLHTLAAHDPYGEKPAPTPPPEKRAALREEAKRMLGEVDFRTHPLPLKTGAWLVEKYLFDDAARNAIGEVLSDDAVTPLWERLFEWLDGVGKGSAEVAALSGPAQRGYREGLGWADRVFARAL